MNQFVQHNYQELLQTIREIPQLKALPVKNPTAVILAVSKSIDQLRAHFETNPFSNRNAEINFFKHEKPKFYCEYIYALRLFTIESNRPQAKHASLINYYERELHCIKCFFDQYRFLYQYYLHGGIELDDVYFTPGKKEINLLLPEAPDAEPDFSSPGEYLFAKFSAFERLEDHLVANLNPAAPFYFRTT